MLKTEGLFRVATDLTLVHELEVHIAMKNYYHITTVSSPHIVSNCLKKMLREMITPLNPFYLYDDFMALTEVDRERRVEPLRVLVHKLPQQNFNTLKFIISFL